MPAMAPQGHPARAATLGASSTRVTPSPSPSPSRNKTSDDDIYRQRTIQMRERKERQKAEAIRMNLQNHENKLKEAGEEAEKTHQMRMVRTESRIQTKNSRLESLRKQVEGEINRRQNRELQRERRRTNQQTLSNNNTKDSVAGYGLVFHTRCL